MRILTDNKIAVVVVAIALIATAIMGVMAWRAKAVANEYRAKINVLEKTILNIREENLAKDRAWKRKLSEAEARFIKSEKRWAKAMSKFNEWEPGDHPAPKSAQETIGRLKALGVDGTARR